MSLAVQHSGARIRSARWCQTPQVFILGHGAHGKGDAKAVLAGAGLEVRRTSSIEESAWLLARARPDVVILEPAEPAPGQAELRLLRDLQREGDPVPVILLVRDLAVAGQLGKLGLPCLDFLLRPGTALECRHRVDLALEVRRRWRSLHRRNRRLEARVAVDFKTGLLSELEFRQVLQVESKRGLRHRQPLALMLMDIDDFKSVNDRFDYAFGDEVLRAVGDAIRASVRETDFAARLGGDEFCVLMPQTTRASALQVALRTRQAIAARPVVSGCHRQQVTVSVGVAGGGEDRPAMAGTLQAQANRALHVAKKSGKNQVAVYGGPGGGNSAEAG